MLRKIDHKNMGGSNLGWLKSIFHFSFAEYYNPENMNFGVLRVVNDDLVEKKAGFNYHPHRDMEIVSYIIDGDLDHGDTMGNHSRISRGHVQYMSAGTGVLHKELNNGDKTLRFLQIWIIPNKLGLKPNYGDKKFEWNERKNTWLNMVSGIDGDAPIKINQDANISVTELDTDKTLEYNVKQGRQAYLVQMEGESVINGISLEARDALEITEENITIKAKNTSHILIIEMQKEDCVQY